MVNYAVRKITVTITLNTGAQQNSTSNTITLSNLRVEAIINKSGIPGTATAQIRIYGITLDHLNQLTRAGTA